MRRRSGFTLIEMMIVLAIIAALAAILTPMGTNALNRAKATQIVADVRNIRAAAQLYYFDEDKVPNSYSGIGNYLDVTQLALETSTYDITNSSGSNLQIVLNNSVGSKILEQLNIAWTSDGFDNSHTFNFSF